MSAIELGRYITQLRKRAGIESQAELARLAHVSYSTVSRIEANQVKPSPGTLRKLAQALGTPVDVLMKAADYLPQEEPPTFAPKVAERYIDVTDIPEGTIKAIE